MKDRSPPTRLAIEVQIAAAGAVVRFKGDDVSLDDETIAALRERLADLAGELGRRSLVLDFAPVTFVSSTVLGALAALNRQIRTSGGSLALRNLSDAVYEVFEVTRLTTLLNVQRTPPVADAIPLAAVWLRPPHILVVDDDEAVRLLLDRVLRQEGFQVSPAATGREALDLVRRRSDDVAVALLDVQLPGWSGPETLLALQAILPRVRCCFMTGDAGAHTEEGLLQLGAAVVFKKPFCLADVVQTVRRLADRAAPCMS